MKLIQGVIAFLVALVLTPVLSNLIPVLGNHLDIVLCLMVMLVFMYDEPVVPLICGTAAGIIYDMAYGLYTGPTSIALAITCVLVLGSKKIINKEVFFNSIIVMLICTMAYKCIYWLIYFVLGSPYTIGYALSYVPLNLLFNSIFALIAFFILYRKVVRRKVEKY